MVAHITELFATAGIDDLAVQICDGRSILGGAVRHQSYIGVRSRRGWYRFGQTDLTPLADGERVLLIAFFAVEPGDIFGGGRPLEDALVAVDPASAREVALRFIELRMDRSTVTRPGWSWTLAESVPTI